MAAITICEKFVSGYGDNDPCAIVFLSKFIASGGDLLVAVDNGMVIMQRYLDLPGEGAGRIQHWVSDLSKVRGFKKISVVNPTKEDVLEIYARVCDKTKEKTLICSDTDDYSLLLNDYLGINVIPRQSVCADPKILEKINMSTILFLASSPEDAARLRLDREYREIDEQLRLAGLREKFNLESVFAARITDMTRNLLSKKPQIVHFAGHGTFDGQICLEDVTGKSIPVSNDALTNLFEALSQGIEAVILNCCYAKPQAEAIAKHIKYVVGVPNSIKDSAAIYYTVGLYQALGEGSNFEDAHKFGVIQIELQLGSLPDANKPTLFIRPE